MRTAPRQLRYLAELGLRAFKQLCGQFLLGRQTMNAYGGSEVQVCTTRAARVVAGIPKEVKDEETFYLDFG